MPHGHCFFWQPDILWLHVGSDICIALAYYAIPVALFLFVRRRLDLEFRWVFILFAAFILACGTTHLMAAYTMWRPFYFAEGLVKLATAGLSVVTAVKLWPLLPQALALPSPGELRKTNDRLLALMREREQAGEERFRLALEASPNGILVVDETGRIAFANAQTEAMFGYTREELIGSPLDNLVPASARARHPGYVKRFQTAAQARPMGPNSEVKAVRKDGTEFPVEVALGPFRYGGALNVIAFIADITYRKTAEKRILQQAGALERSNQDLETFVYAASHDLQEPLRGMMGYLQLLQRRFQDALPERAGYYLRQAVDSGERMGGQMDALLQYSRVGRSGDEEDVDLDRVAREVLRDLRVTVQEAGAKIEVQPLPVVRFNEVEARQIFQNLISNALKFRSEKGTRVTLGVRSENGETVFFVADNGIGIPKEFQDRLFQLFQRLHARSAYDGSGIGLALVAKAVRARGGRIWVESEPGRGSTFLFTLGSRTGTTVMAGPA